MGTGSGDAEELCIGGDNDRDAREDNGEEKDGGEERIERADEGGALDGEVHEELVGAARLRARVDGGGEGGEGEAGCTRARRGLWSAEGRA